MTDRLRSRRGDSESGCKHDDESLINKNSTIITLALRLKVKRYNSPEQVISELQDISCNMWSHSVTCHPTQVNTPRLNPSQTSRYLIYLPRRDGRLSWPSWQAAAGASCAIKKEPENEWWERQKETETHACSDDGNSPTDRHGSRLPPIQPQSSSSASAFLN